MTIKALCLGRAMVGLVGFLSSNHDAAECGGIGLLDHVFQRCQLNDQPLGGHKGGQRVVFCKPSQEKMPAKSPEKVSGSPWV